MLTPQDLQEVCFEKAKIGGYVMKSVDDFLEPLMEDYVTLYKENAVLKSKMRLLVERLEAYRANEAKAKAAEEAAQTTRAAMLEDARRQSEEIVAQANKDARSASRNADSAASAETERLRQAKEATAEFVRAVEAQLARQQQALDALKALGLPSRQEAEESVRIAPDYEGKKKRPAPPRPFSDSPENIAAQIEQSVSRITGDAPRPKFEFKLDPDTTAKSVPTLDERTTAKFANLKFGKNYRPE